MDSDSQTSKELDRQSRTSNIEEAWMAGVELRPENFDAKTGNPKRKLEPRRKFRMVKSDTGIHAEMMVSHYKDTSEVEICLNGKLVAVISSYGIELCTLVDPSLGILLADYGQLRTFIGRASSQKITPAMVARKF
jgi:hypothetical protein